MSYDWLGYTAGIVTSLCYLPQITKIIRLREARDISTRANLLLCFGLSLWTAFGFLQGDWPIVAANMVSIGLVIGILALKYHYSAPGNP